MVWAVRPTLLTAVGAQERTQLLMHAEFCAAAKLI